MTIWVVFLIFFCYFVLFEGKIRTKSICLFDTRKHIQTTERRTRCAVCLYMVTFVYRFTLNANKLEKLNSARIACRKPIKGRGWKNGLMWSSVIS